MKSSNWDGIAPCNSSAEKVLRMLMSNKLHMSQQCALAARKIKSLKQTGLYQQSTAPVLRGVVIAIIPLCAVFNRSYLQHCIQVSALVQDLS